MNWVVKKLGDLLKIQNGYAFDSKLFSTDGEMPLIRIRDIKKGVETETHYTGEYDSKYIVKKGDLLIGMDGEFGCYEWKGSNALLNQRVCRLQSFENQIYPRFLLYGINSYLKAIEDVTGYTTVKHLSSKQIANIEFPLPPLATQQKIVAKLDSIFAEIEKATAAAAANAKNAEALFQSYLTEIFECDKDGWTQTKLKDIAEYFNGLTYSPKNVSDDGTIVLRSSNVQADKICLNDIVRVNSTIKDKLYVKQGDILMCSRNGSQRLVGKTATIGNLDEKMTFGTFMMIVRSENNFFIEWFFKSDLFKRQIVSGENTMINQITRYMLDEIVIPMPDLSIQMATSIKISNLYDVSEKLKISYLKKIEDLYAYKKSILFQAFNGELVKD